MLSVVWSSGVPLTWTSGSTIGVVVLITGCASSESDSTVPVATMVSAVRPSEKPAAFESVGVRVMVWVNTPAFAVDSSIENGDVPPASSVPNAPRPVSVIAASPLAVKVPDSQSAGAPVGAMLATFRASVTVPAPWPNVPRSTV